MFRRKKKHPPTDISNGMAHRAQNQDVTDYANGKRPNVPTVCGMNIQPRYVEAPQVRYLQSCPICFPQGTNYVSVA